MLAVLNLPGRVVLRLDLKPAEVVPEVEARLRWILADFAGRQEALWELDLDAVKSLLPGLYDEAERADDVERRVAILNVAAALGPSAPVGAELARAGLEASAAVAPELVVLRVAATRALGSSGDLTAVGELWALAAAPQPEVARAALASLCRLGEEATVDRLIGEAQARGDLELEQAAALGVARRRALEIGEDSEARMVMLSLPSRLLHEDLFGLARVLGPDLAEAAADRENPLEVRWRAVHVMAVTAVRLKKMINFALAIATDETEALDLRVESVRYLGRVRAPGAAPVVAVLLEAPATALQDATIVALGRMGDTRVLGALLNHHEDREGAVRALVAEAVGELARPLGEETYRAWLAGERDLSPQTAYFFDPALTTAFPGEALRELVTNADVKVRREAILLFGLLGRDPAEAAWLDTIARAESDDVTRALAERSARLLETRAAGRP